MEINLNNFGEHLKFIRSNSKTKLTDKKIFVNTIKNLEACWKRSNYSFVKLGINLFSYEEAFYITIENLLFLYFGELKTELILFYVFSRFDEKGELIPFTIYIEENKEEKYLIENINQLWDLSVKLEEIYKYGK